MQTEPQMRHLGKWGHSPQVPTSPVQSSHAIFHYITDTKLEPRLGPAAAGMRISRKRES